MREYRAKRRILENMDGDAAKHEHNVRAHYIQALERIAELEAEVMRLKRELAARPERNPFTEFRPVPKPGK